MRLGQDELERALYRDWRALRESDKLRLLLPSCRTRQWVRDDGVVGYSTLNYSAQRDVTLPIAHGETSPCRASLLEKYWAVRTLNGTQDPNWLPSLNLNVVHITHEPITAEDCESALRTAIVLRQSVWQPWFVKNEQQAALYVRACIIGPEIDQPASLLASMDVLREIPLTIARFQFSVAEGFSFIEPPDVERFWFIVVTDRAAASDFASALLGEDELPTDDFKWKGTNKGPVYDSRTGLTMQDGTFL